MELIIENVRSFVGRHDIPIKPLTLLVGENSAGKSTLLSLLSIVSDTFRFPLRPNFNMPPYSLGNFDTIATHRSAGDKRAASFRIGRRLLLLPTGVDYEITAEYTNRNGAVEVSSIAAKSEDTTGVINFLRHGQSTSIECLLHNKGQDYVLYRGALAMETLGPRGPFFLLQLLQVLFLSSPKHDGVWKNTELDLLQHEFLGLFNYRVVGPPLSLAPVRMKPQRTYDLIQMEFSPEGEHIPAVLPTLLNNPEQRRLLEDFGKESGLYRSLEVRASDNVQDYSARVMVTGSGPAANLTDTGYGVSQALPVVVESIRAESSTMLLLQQPEVHLHPRAQAALGTLFVELIKAENKQFVIETHSDYIIDRVRIEVAKGNISAEDVCILYFEKPEDATRVYPITLDSGGNILNAPPSYRDFFLKETLTLLGAEGG